MSLASNATDMTVAPPVKRDYSLTGPSARHAVEAGLVAAEWYHTDVPRKVMKDLMQRSDGPALRDTALWIALHIATAAGGIILWGSWWAVPFWFAYGVLYGSACDSRWHECGHGTAFRTRWMNDWVYHIASFQVMRNPVSWRWSHARHHTDTIIAGRDVEIAWTHPINLLLKTLAYVGFVEAWLHLGKAVGLQHLAQRTHLAVAADGDHVVALALGLARVLQRARAALLGVDGGRLAELGTHVRLGGHAFFQLLDPLRVARHQAGQHQQQNTDPFQQARLPK